MDPQGLCGAGSEQLPGGPFHPPDLNPSPAPTRRQRRRWQCRPAVLTHGSSSYPPKPSARASRQGLTSRGPIPVRPDLGSASRSHGTCKAPRLNGVRRRRQYRRFCMTGDRTPESHRPTTLCRSIPGPESLCIVCASRSALPRRESIYPVGPIWART